MSNILKINVSTLENYQNEFNNEFNNFKNSANSTFENSYLNRSSDSIVRSMCSGLQSHYSRIEKGYTNINNWWISYINNVYNLENFLAGNCGTGGIDDPATLFAIGYLFNLEGYENIIEDTFSANNDSYSSTFSFDDPTLLANQTADQGNSNQDKNLLATVATTGLSFLEGLGKFGEAIVDAECLGYAVMATPYTGIVDGFQFLYGKITGNEWESVTKKMWNQTKAFVAEEHVTDWVDNFYENNHIGQVLKNNSYHFNEIRNISSGIGYGAGVIILTVATFGAGGAVVGGTAAASGGVTAANLALTAGVAALGRETEAAWADGADIVEGLVRGAVGGLWEAGQYYLGGQISQLNLFGNGGIFKGATSSALNNIMNIGVRAVLDGADAGLDSAVQPLMNAIYKDGYYNTNGEYVEFSSDASFADKYEKLFEENGGMKGVLINAAIGSGISLISELGNLFKKPKTLEGEIVDNDNFIENPKQELPPNQTIIDVEGERIGVDYETLDGDVIKDLPTGSKDLIEEFDAKGIGEGSVKGLPPWADDIDVTTNSKNLTGDVSTEKLDIFKEPEIPETKVKTDIIDLDDTVLDSKSIKNVDSGKSNINQIDNGLTTNSKKITGDISTEKLEVFEETKIPKTEVKTDAIDTAKTTNIPKKLTKTDAKGNLYTIPTSRELTPKEIEALKEFDFNFYLSDNKSSGACVETIENALTESMKSGNDDAYYYLKAINKLKTINPDLNFSTCGDVTPSHWSSANLSLQLDDESILGNHFSVAYHESGHMLWNLINRETMPDNWDDIVRRAQTHAFQDGRFRRTIFNLDIQYNDLVDTAKRKFSDMIFQTKNMSLSEYYSSIKNKYVGELSQSGNITDVLRKAGLNDNSINSFFSSNGKISLDDLATYAANTEYNNVLFKFQTNLAYTEYPALVAESDMINAVYKTRRYQNGTSFLHFGHPEGYYTRNAISSLHELIANFTELKLINDIPSQSAIYEFKELFGDELYGALDNLYKGFLEFGK